jgi:hypothetical protein
LQRGFGDVPWFFYNNVSQSKTTEGSFENAHPKLRDQIIE